MRIVILTIISSLSLQGHALSWHQLEKGTKVELIENMKANELFAPAFIECRAVDKAVRPKVTIGPSVGENVIPVRFFTVVAKYSDVLTYRIYLHSRQLPCACVVNLDQAPAYLKGKDAEFDMFKIADPTVMDREPNIPSSCENYPDWLNIPDNPSINESEGLTI